MHSPSERLQTAKLAARLKQDSTLRRITLALAGVFFLAVASGAAAPDASGPDTHELAEEALTRLYNLEYAPAISGFRRSSDQDPDQPMPHNFLAYTYLLQEMERLGDFDRAICSESKNTLKALSRNPNPAFVERFGDELNQAMAAANRRLRENPEDGEALYGMGVAHMLKAFFTFRIRKNALEGLNHARKAQRFCRRSVKIDPYFYDAYLVTGLYDYALGSLPGFAKFLLFFKGMKGNKQMGLVEVQAAASHGKRNLTASRIILAILLGRERQWETVREIVAGLESRYPRNHYLPLFLAAVWEKEGKTEDALAVYDSVLDRIGNSAPGFERAPVSRIRYQAAVLLLRNGNNERSVAYLDRIIKEPQASNKLKEMAQMVRGSILAPRADREVSGGS